MNKRDVTLDEETVEEIAAGARARVAQVTDQARGELAELQGRLGELRQELAQRATAARGRATGELRSAAGRIRRRAAESGDAREVEKAGDLAEDLERKAAHLEQGEPAEAKATPEAVRVEVHEVETAAQSDVWLAFTMGFGLGVIIGVLIGVAMRR